MFHLWVIALFAALVARDSMDAPLLGGWLSDTWVSVCVGGAMLVVGVLAHVVIVSCAGSLRRHGSERAVRLADAALIASRWAAAIVYFTGVVALGWLDVVRRVIGDLVLVDEAVAMLPALVVFAWGWWAIWPMEKLLRDAVMIRQLDEGGAVYALPRRGRFVALNLRHHVLVWLAPLLLILTWVEVSHVVLARLAALGGAFAFLRDDATLAAVGAGAQLVGVVLVFLVLGPLAMRCVWETVPLEPGPLRDRLSALCRRHRVRVDRILVWRTHGTMINGAVLGLTPAFRYVLLTDALLDSLPDDQVEAVMAHEVAHVRHRHIIWLSLTLLVTLSAIAMVAEFVLGRLGVPLDGDGATPGMELAVALVSFALAMLVFGLVSRRFEWQADAFAAAHMSERLRLLDAPGVAPAPAVSPDGAGAMVGALRSVAELNHIPLDRSSFRHGSIRARVERLAALVGTPVSRAPIDATARAIKVAALVCLLSLLAIAAMQMILGV